MPIPKVLAQSEMQTALSRIWTRVANSISYNDNHYAKCASPSIVVWRKSTGSASLSNVMYLIPRWHLPSLWEYLKPIPKEKHELKNILSSNDEYSTREFETACTDRCKLS